MPQAASQNLANEFKAAVGGILITCRDQVSAVVEQYSNMKKQLKMVRELRKELLDPYVSADLKKKATKSPVKSAPSPSTTDTAEQASGECPAIAASDDPPPRVASKASTKRARPPIEDIPEPSDVSDDDEDDARRVAAQPPLTISVEQLDVEQLDVVDPEDAAPAPKKKKKDKKQKPTAAKPSDGLEEAWNAAEGDDQGAEVDAGRPEEGGASTAPKKKKQKKAKANAPMPSDDVEEAGDVAEGNDGGAIAPARPTDESVEVQQLKEQVQQHKAKEYELKHQVKVLEKANEELTGKVKSLRAITDGTPRSGGRKDYSSHQSTCTRLTRGVKRTLDSGGLSTASLQEELDDLKREQEACALRVKEKQAELARINQAKGIA